MEVEFKGVNKTYNSFTAVDNLNLKIENGSLHFLLGPSGCGKTTTLRMLAGLESISSGDLFFNGKNVTHLPASERGIGIVFQNYALWPHMTVFENIKYGLKIKKYSPKEISSRIEETLELTQLTPYKNRLPNQLSGGQQQRVALARALAIKPNVLLLDEPLSNLDTKLRLDMRDNIARIHRETGITTFYVTHDQKEALSMGTHVTVLKDGKEIQTGAPKDLYLHPRTSFLAGFIGETNLIEGEYLGKDKDLHCVNTSLGQLKSKSVVRSLEKGEKVTLSIRPEAFHLRQDYSDLINKISLELDFSTYLGELEQLNLKLSSSQNIKINYYDTDEKAFSSGDMIPSYISPDKIIVFPRSES